MLEIIEKKIARPKEPSKGSTSVLRVEDGKICEIHTFERTKVTCLGGGPKYIPLRDTEEGEHST